MCQVINNNIWLRMEICWPSWPKVFENIFSCNYFFTTKGVMRSSLMLPWPNFFTSLWVLQNGYLHSFILQDNVLLTSQRKEVLKIKIYKKNKTTFLKKIVFKSKDFVCVWFDIWWNKWWWIKKICLQKSFCWRLFYNHKIF